MLYYIPLLQSTVFGSYKLFEKAFTALPSRRPELFFSVGSIKTFFLCRNLHGFYVTSESPSPHMLMLSITVLIFFWYTLDWALESKQRIS